MATLAIAPSMVGDEPETIGNSRFGHERLKGVGDERSVNENDWLAGASDRVVKRDGVDFRSPH
jgi:hypothetical protein